MDWCMFQEFQKSESTGQVFALLQRAPAELAGGGAAAPRRALLRQPAPLRRRPGLRRQLPRGGAQARPGCPGAQEPARGRSLEVFARAALSISSQLSAEIWQYLLKY